MAADLRAFPWAAGLDADQLAAFIEDLWGAASGDDDLTTLDAIENAVARHAPTPQSGRSKRHCPLTERELAVLTHIAGGATYLETAHALGITVNTVRHNCGRILPKIGARTMVQAAAAAAHFGWTPASCIPPDPTPVLNHSPTSWQSLVRRRVAEMRAQPGVPVDIGPYGSISGARGTAWRINKGLLASVRPTGAFKAQAVRGEQGLWVVRARYVGEPATAPIQEGTAS